MNAVEKVLNRIGYDGYLVKDETYRPVGERALYAYVRPTHLHMFLHVLRHNEQFYEDQWDHLHADIGLPRTSFRSFKGLGAISVRSAQLVINTENGYFYADVDLYNTQDLINIAGHVFIEVIKWPWRRA